jgi:lipopolysaccharide transport system ATP-binding protein
MSYVIKAEKVTKIYQIRHQSGQLLSLRESLDLRFRKIISAFGVRLTGPAPAPQEQPDVEEYEALRDVSFEVKRGQNLGIIGQNGAGKSTLLKILSRITEPTAGKITLRGRVSSLLEVGTGFHPELSGRENIFLNGAILGMSRVEIKKKFDEIVNFSEIEQFIDTPVKYYSSGMYVRLAFAVAAHLDPEILILDEVLAVGDQRFQQKCLQKMQLVNDSGKTILFVSHSMQAVVQICPTCVLLEKGIVRYYGPTADAIKSYMASPDTAEDEPLPDNLAIFCPNRRIGDDDAQLIEACIRDTRGEIRGSHLIHESIFIEMQYAVFPQASKYLVPNFHIYNAENILVGTVCPPNGIVKHYEPGRYKATCQIPPNLINEGVYRVLLALSSFEGSVTVHFSAPSALQFEIKDDLSDISFRNGYMHSYPGLIRPRFDWTVGKIE